MKNSLLIPNNYKVIGWIVFLIFVVLGFFCVTKEFRIPNFQFHFVKEGSAISFADYNLTNELAILGITIGLLMIVFSKEKQKMSILPCLD